MSSNSYSVVILDVIQVNTGIMMYKWMTYLEMMWLEKEFSSKDCDLSALMVLWWIDIDQYQLTMVGWSSEITDLGWIMVLSKAG